MDARAGAVISQIRKQRTLREGTCKVTQQLEAKRNQSKHILGEGLSCHFLQDLERLLGTSGCWEDR